MIQIDNIENKARVVVNGVEDTIRNHLQKAKVYLMGNELVSGVQTKNKPIAFKYKGMYLPLEYLDMYYKLLWYKYLNLNKDFLIKYKSLYMGNHNIIDMFIKDSGALYSMCEPLVKFIKGDSHIIFTTEPILNPYVRIIGVNVNCEGLLSDSPLYANTNANKEYLKYCFNNEPQDLLRMVQFVEDECIIVANMFTSLGKESIDYSALRDCLKVVKEYAIMNKYPIGLPYKLGCSIKEEWDIVLGIIEEIFNDYYVIIYKDEIG